MALNFQQVFEKIREIGLGARARQETQEGLRLKARALLADWADKNLELRDTLLRMYDPVRLFDMAQDQIDGKSIPPGYLREA